MACFDFLAAAPVNGDGDTFIPRAISGSQVYGITVFPKVQIYTWPGLSFVSTYATPASATGVDVAVDDSGNVYHSENTGSTTTTIYKNGSSLSTITVAANRSGGGIAFADGWVWCVVSTDDGADSGALYRIDPDDGTTTTPFTVSGSRLAASVYAATDGAVWFSSQPSGTVRRHLGGSTSSVALGAVSHLTPRPGGTMMARRNSPAAWVDIDTSMTVTAAACDPTAVAGASPPPARSFANASVTDVGLLDTLNDIYRAEIAALTRRWTVGAAGWT